MNNNIKKVICSVCILTVFATVAAAIDNPTYITTQLNWRLYGFNYNDDHYSGPYYTAGFSGWCSENHRTSAGHKYDHFHNETTLPIWDGYRQLTITESMVDAYWDWRYDGYSDCGGLDPTTNCYAYATGHDTWVDGINTILDDEYVATNDVDAEIVNLYGHMLKIIGYFPCPEDVTDASYISEKYRDSGIYDLCYLHTKWPNPDPDTFWGDSYTSD